jgi:type I restriction enzyme S subunit
MSELIYSNDWGYFRLTNLAEYHNGYSFRPSDWSESGLPIIRIEQINNPNGFCDRYSGSPPKINLIDDGDLIFSWSATLKVVIWKGGPAVLNQHLFRVDEKNNFDKRYIFFLLDFHMESLGGNSHGSTMKHIKRSELDKFRVRVPNLKLQQKIATILTSIDAAIEKTEALIEKYQQIKSGLMHDLFTRGVLPNGQLRPTREQAPELYQETKIGWIPKEWDCDYLKRYLISPPKNGYSPNEIDYWDGIYVLGLGCLTKNGFNPKQLKKVNYKAAISSGAILNDGDILISRANTPELVGLCGIYKDIGEKVIYPDLMMRISLSSTLDKFYFEQLMLHSSTRNQIKALAVGTSSSMVKLNSTSLKKLIIKVPSPKEQMRIVETIRPFENQLVALTLQLKKLQSQKLGLMQDLLTGKVPVTVSENADQEEAHA